MRANSRVDSPSFEEIPPDVQALEAALQQVPLEHRLPLVAVVARVVESTRRRRRILALVQDALGQLRLDMKYLVFDLEATRRERDGFRRLAEGAPE